MFGKVVYLANVKTVVYMETNKSIAKRIIESYSLSFNNEITSRLADIVYSRELGRGELFLDEGQVSKSMGYVEKGIVRQFYYKNKRKYFKIDIIKFIYFCIDIGYECSTIKI